MATQESTLRVGVDSKPMVDGAKRGEQALGKLGAKGKQLGKTFDGVTSKTNLVAAAFTALSAVGIGAFFLGAVRAAASFEVKLAEISTLVDTTVFAMDKLEAALLRQSAQFGSNAVEQGAAAYQIISAGASTATDAINLLTASNKLAVGGVTDVATAADGLTSLLNAYGLASTEATNVSDALFVGMRAGKTTIGELSASLGKVAPLAAQAGVGIDEMVAAVSALTKGGIKTTEAVTGVRAIMAAIVKPTKEATELADKLGIAFTAASLETKGLGAFMAELVQKTGGSTDAMAQLFGGVEALIPALALAGQAGVDMSNIMADMATKSGATQAAFEKMSNTFSFQAAVLRGNLMKVIIELGSVLTSILTPALRFLNENFEALSRFVAVAASGFAALLIPAILAMIPAVATATAGLLAMAAAWLLTPFGQVAALIIAASAALAYFGDVNIKVGGYTVTVWQAFTTAVSVAWDLLKEGAAIISDLFGKATGWAGGFFSKVIGWLSGFVGDWSDSISGVGDLIKTGVNLYIGFYVGLVKAIGAIVTTGVPAAFNLALGAVRNLVLDSVAFIVNTFAKAIGAVGDALAYLPGVADDLGSSIREALSVDFDDLRADTDALKATFNSAGTAIKDAFGSAQIDYIGAAGEAIGSVGDALQNRFNDKLRDANEELLMAQAVLPAVAAAASEVVVPAVDALAKSADGASKAMKELNKEKQAFIDGINDEFAAIQEANGGAVAATEKWYQDQKTKLEALGLAFTEYADKLEVIFAERMTEAYAKDLENATDWRSGVEAAVMGLGETVGTEADLAGAAVESIFNNAASAITDFAKTGTLDFKKFASSVAADILMMTTKMLLLAALKAAFGGFADGGPVGVQEFANGGAVRGAGGPRSDSIPAMLSNGEYVINADATKQFGPMLEAINSGNIDMMGLAAGGLSNDSASLPSAPPNSTLAQNSDGDTNKAAQMPNIIIMPSLSNADVAGALDSDEGDRVLVRMIERGKTTIKGVLA